MSPDSDAKSTILIVDDERRLADSLVRIFQRAGYHADAVYSGEEALASLQNEQPSLMLTDVIMPGMSGVELAKKVRNSWPNCRILLFSGNANTQNLLQVAEADGHDFDILAKPVPPREIVAKVASMLETAPQ